MELYEWRKRWREWRRRRRIRPWMVGHQCGGRLAQVRWSVLHLLPTAAVISFTPALATRARRPASLYRLPEAGHGACEGTWVQIVNFRYSENTMKNKVNVVISQGFIAPAAGPSGRSAQGAGKPSSWCLVIAGSEKWKLWMVKNVELARVVKAATGAIPCKHRGLLTHHTHLASNLSVSCMYPGF